MLRVIHFSDLHIGNEKKGFKFEKFIESLLSDLEKFVNNETIVCITGDLIDKGGSLFEKSINPYAFFDSTFLKPIYSKFPILRNRIFIVPGNHDVKRSKVDEYAYKGIRSSLKTSESISEFIDRNADNLQYLNHIQDYILWNKVFCKNYESLEIDNFSSSGIVKLGNQNIGISCLNTSWLCVDDVQKGDVILGARQIERSIQYLKDTDIKIALMHHPIEYISECENSYIRSLLFKNFDILFTGHVHDLNESYIQELSGNLFVSVAQCTTSPFNASRQNYENGYTVLTVEENIKIDVLLRKYSERREIFVANNEYGNDEGMKSFPIHERGTSKSVDRLYEYVSLLENRLFEKLNSHVIISSDVSEKMSTIDGIFVEPTMKNAPAGTAKSEDTINYTIDSMIASTNNYILCGERESGKTILLDKIFKEFIRKFHIFAKMPILIKYGELRSHSVEDVVREFIGLSKKEYKEIEYSTKFVFLIDDLTFLDTSTNSFMTDLSIYLHSHQNFQLIATVTQTLTGFMPIEYLNYSGLLAFNIVYIHNFSTKQIRQLIERWYNGKTIDSREKIERIIESFQKLGLPKNPLSVTMFLWIFENQEKKPINNAVLVEAYVEKVLEKTRIENVYSETFDFTNKKRLLAYLSKYFKDHGDSDNGYQDQYCNVLTYINSYLSQKYHCKAQNVLDDFIVRGILCQDERSNVRFKFAFLFQYFIAVYVDHDKEFRESLFIGNNFLNYVDEIGYYTGLKRDDTFILDFANKRLSEAFECLNPILSENFKEIDEILEIRNSHKPISLNFENPKECDKPQNSDLDKIYDHQLDAVQPKILVPKKDISEIDLKKKLDAVLQFTAMVFKNSEEVDDFELRIHTFKNVITSSISTLFVYRNYLIDYFNKNQKPPEGFPENFSFRLYIKLLPLINQILLHTWMGSPKFKAVFEHVIDENKNKENISEYEKCLIILMFCDSKCQGYPDVLKENIFATKSKYLKDLYFMKLYGYFILRSSNADLDKLYINLMMKIRNELGQTSSKNNGKFIEDIKAEKKEKRREHSL